MAPHLDLRLCRRKPSQALAGKFGENNLNVFRHLQKAKRTGYHHTGRKSNIAPVTSVALKEKKKHIPNNLQTSSLYFWWLFFPPPSNLSTSTLQNTISSTTLPHINFSPGWFYILFLSLNVPTLRVRFSFNTLLEISCCNIMEDMRRGSVMTSEIAQFGDGCITCDASLALKGGDDGWKTQIRRLILRF